MKQVDSRPRMKVFSFYDSKAESFSPTPLFYETTGLAIRAFEASCNKPGSGFFEHPEDYTFFEIGEYNDLDCTFVMLDAKKSLANALALKKSDPTSV